MPEENLKELVMSLFRRVEKLEETHTSMQNSLLVRQGNLEREVRKIRTDVMAAVSEDVDEDVFTAPMDKVNKQ